ncbi:MAG: hypothetical protein EPN82_06060 [Bacteroidetes bacterium]|nr:MAG: hypothetical protein EPN82_06060 [Bacteroidota bacterium]
MEIEEIMIDYFEGDTTLDIERQMFSEISRNDTLITEFKNFLLIDKAMKASVETFTSPPDLTNSIFKKLGYSIPPVMKVRQLPFAFLKNKFFSHALVSVASIILTLAVIFAFFYPFANNKSVAADNNNIQPGGKTGNNFPLTASREIKPEKITRNNIYAKQQNNKKVFDNENDTQGLGEGSFNENITLSNIDASAEYKLSHNYSNKLNILNNDKSVFRTFNINYSEPVGFSFGIDNTPDWSIMKPAIEPNSVSSFNNLCISLNYDISSDFRIGAEVRQESIYTEYTGKINSDTLYLYKQQNNLTSFGANVQFYPYDLGPVSSYLRINLGVNKGGFIMRQGGGIEYNAYRDLAFALGFEYTYYRFFHQKDWFGTSKVGINYGVLIKF